MPILPLGRLAACLRANGRRLPPSNPDPHRGELVMRRTLIAASLAAAFSTVPLAAAAAPGYVLNGTEIFAGPGDEYPLVARLGPGVRVEVNGCISDYSWCDVFFGGNRGWMYAGDLAYTYRNSRVPILQYGPSLSVPIITFSLGNYWDRYYRGRPWYRERGNWERHWHDRGDYGWRGNQQWRGNDRNDWRGNDRREWRGNDRNDRRGSDRNEWRGNNNDRGRIEQGNQFRHGRDTDPSDRDMQKYGPRIRDQAHGEARPDLPRGNGQPHAIGPSSPNYYNSQQ
jgi:uncharacterized protein YraI